MPAAPRGRWLARARRLLPWLLAAGVLAVLLWRVPLAELAAALRAGPALAMALYVAAATPAVLAADGWATWRALGACGLEPPLGEVVRARGATYLLGLVNYAAGQGGIGFYVHALGAPVARTAGIVLFLLITSAWALLAVAVAGLPAVAPDAALAALAAAAGGALLYALVVCRAPPALRRRPALAPLFEAGLGGSLRAVASRMAHVLVLVAALWGGLRLWGIEVPIAEGLLRLPVVLLAAALPVTPAGLGTTQAAFVLLFADRSAAPTAAEREADVLAFALVWSGLALIAQAAVGLWCSRRLVVRPRSAAAGRGGGR